MDLQVYTWDGKLCIPNGLWAVAPHERYPSLPWVWGILMESSVKEEYILSQKKNHIVKKHIVGGENGR